MKRYVSILLLNIVCFVLQTTVFQHLKIAGMVPNMLVIITAASGFMFGRRTGMFSGVVGGLLMDLLYGNVIGIGVLILTCIGYANGVAIKDYFKDGLIIPAISFAISDLCFGFFYYVCNFMLRGRFDFGFYLSRIIISEMLYTIIVGVVLFKLMRLLDDKLYPVHEKPVRAKQTSGSEID